MATPTKRQRTTNPVPTLTDVIFDHILPDWKGNNPPAKVTMMEGKPAYHYQLSNGSRIIYVPPEIPEQDRPYSPTDAIRAYTPPELQQTSTTQPPSSRYPLVLPMPVPLRAQSNKRHIPTINVSDSD
jgi:hypothetical protein